jgi:MerR family mercuric resistance operon transcriptional regulator
VLLRLAEGKPTCRQVLDIALPRLEDVRARLRALRQMEDALDAMVSRCSGGDERDCAILDALDIDRRTPSELARTADADCWRRRQFPPAR